MPNVIDAFTRRLREYVPQLAEGWKVLGREFDPDWSRVYEFHDDFELTAGATLKLPWVEIDLSAAGSPTTDYVANAAYGQYALQLANTNEAENIGLYFGDHLPFRVYNDAAYRGKTYGAFAEWVIKLTPSATFVAGDVLTVGVAGVRGAAAGAARAPDAVAISAWFRIEAGVNIYCESDDGTAATEKDDIDTGYDVNSGTTATRLRLRIDFSDPRDVKFYLMIEGASGNIGKGLVRVCPTTTFDMSAADISLQPWIQLEKSGGTTTHLVNVDEFTWRGERLVGSVI